MGTGIAEGLYSEIDQGKDCSIARWFRWSAAPPEASPTQRRNYINVQVDAVGVGLLNAATPFVPVFLARLGASNFQVGILTALPGVTGLFLALAVGRYLQRQRQIVPWFARSRFLISAAYTLTGLVTMLVGPGWAVPAVLVIWAAATLPQVVLNVSFSVVMNGVAGPLGRYELMSRRWTILGVVTTLAVAVVGEVLARVAFPLNYQLVFLGLSAGGFISLYYSTHIALPDATPPPAEKSRGEGSKAYIQLIRSQPAFVSFALKRFVYFSALALAVPLFPLYYVRVLHASDSWISFISIAQTATAMIGYMFWARASRARGARFVLIGTTTGLMLYPALAAATQRVELITLLAALAGIFQAGLDLVFFDELMKTVPPAHTATFVALAQGMQYLATVAAPLVGTLLSNQIGLGGGLLVSAALRLVGVILFLRPERAKVSEAQASQSAGAQSARSETGGRMKYNNQVGLSAGHQALVERILENESLTAGLEDEPASQLLQWGTGQVPELVQGLKDEEAAGARVSALMALMRRVSRTAKICSGATLEDLAADVGALAEGYAGVRANARPTSAAEVQEAVVALSALQPGPAVTFLINWLDAKRAELTDRGR